MDGLHKGDESLIKAAQTGEGCVELTPELMQQISDNLKERFADIEERYPKLVEACPYEMKLAVVAWTMRHIVEHARDGGTFRHLIYDRLGFDVDAYVPLYDAGGMTISNEFFLSGQPEDDGLAKRLIDSLWPKDGKTVVMEGGKEPWITVCDASDRIVDLTRQLMLERPKRDRLQAELDSRSKS